jgi:hypothetical protein
MVHRKIPPMRMAAVFETPDMITEDKGKGVLLGTIRGTGGLVLAGSCRHRVSTGKSPLVEIINAEGLIIIQTVWATTPDRRQGPWVDQH